MSEIPKFVFVIPYRDREEHYIFFTRYMTFILEDMEEHKDYEMCFVHQNDDRPFNRGALKNIGFLYYKEKFPESYGKIQFVFHDIDTIPYSKEVFDYETKQGVVKHFYGYNYALGGILTVYGNDFEKTNGFPGFWSWGYEDNILQKRVLKSGLTIDRSQFYKIRSREILQFFDGFTRNMSVESMERTRNHTDKDGLSSIVNIDYNFDEENKMLHVFHFDTYLNPDNEHFVKYNIRNGNKVNRKILVRDYNKNNKHNPIQSGQQLMFTGSTNNIKNQHMSKDNKPRKI